MRLHEDWGQKEQSSGQAPDFALTIEHRSTLLPRHLILAEFDMANRSKTSCPLSSDKDKAYALSIVLSEH
ncbi:MAG: hypothetical protein HY758_06065 [Nitrospirae bacterium]|nr:hypothetical protein [Nitrospirota bacterium]